MIGIAPIITDFGMVRKSAAQQYASYIFSPLSNSPTLTYTGGDNLTSEDYLGQVVSTDGVVNQYGQAVPPERGARYTSVLAEGAYAEGVLTMLDTAPGGLPLMPSTVEQDSQGPKSVYTSHTEWSAGQVVTAGDYRTGIATDGARRYYKALTGGTTDGTAPTWPTSGSVTEATSGIEWEYQGYHTLEGSENWQGGTNLLSYPEEFDNVAWSKSGATVTADTIAAPDGESTADSFTANGASSAHAIFQGVTMNGDYAWSVFAKADTGQFLQVLTQQTANGFVNFDLVNGTFNASGATGNIESFGNGWYRCSMSWLDAGIDPAAVYVAHAESLSDVRYPSNSLSSNIYVWGADLKSGVLSPYVPTTTGTATRTASNTSESWAGMFGGTGPVNNFQTRGEFVHNDFPSNAMLIDLDGTARAYAFIGGGRNLQTNFGGLLATTDLPAPEQNRNGEVYKYGVRKSSVDGVSISLTGPDGNIVEGNDIALTGDIAIDDATTFIGRNIVNASYIQGQIKTLETQLNSDVSATWYKEL